MEAVLEIIASLERIVMTKESLEVCIRSLIYNFTLGYWDNHKRVSKLQMCPCGRHPVRRVIVLIRIFYKVKGLS